MSGLFHTLNIGSQSLFASRQGVDTTGHNIANAHTDGYSRQRVNLKQRHPSEKQGILRGNGVFVYNITRAHNKFIERSLNRAKQDLGNSEAYHRELKGLEEVFSPELNITTDKEMSAFFNAAREVSNFPEDLTVRTSFKESAINLAASFKRVDRDLNTRRNDINQKIVGHVGEINKLLKGIAKLNVTIQTAEAGEKQESGDLRDQQDRLLRSLSEKIAVEYYRGDMGMIVVRGPDEALFVDRDMSAELGARVQENAGQLFEVVVNDTDGNRVSVISEANTAGELKALFNVRDERIPELMKHNNELAYTLADRVNQIHRQGYGLNDYKETKGRNLFSLSEDMDNAAGSIEIESAIWETTDAISVAATPWAPGDNVLSNDIVRLETEKVLLNDNATFNDYYATYVGSYGLEVVRAGHVKEADEVSMNELKSKREAISGVSMDEEAANLLKWQANFTASSRVITTVDEMLETVLSLKR